tara:strand:+ start:3877 stop:4404 length:528 start_codon:yes stop_codon:yes gene_type:complete
LILFVHIPKTAGQSIFSVVSSHWNYVEHAKHDPLFLLERNNNIVDAYKFSVVRNPYRRTFSYYKHFNKVNHTEYTFGQFLDIIKSGASFPKTKMIPYSQSFYCLNTVGDIGLDKIYKFENLKELESDLSVSLPYINKGSYSEVEYFNSYGQRERNFVRDYYSSDFYNFEYTTDFL